MKLVTTLSFLAASALLVTSGRTQPSAVVLPNTVPLWVADNEPFAGASPKRYQQWFSASELTLGLMNPVRIVGLRFPAWTPGGQPGAVQDLQVSMAISASPFEPVTFQNTGLEVVVPRGSYTLGAATGFPISFDFKQFSTEFVWDGSSSIILEIKIWDNGRGGNPFPFSMQATFTAFGATARLIGYGPNPDGISTPSVVQSNAGVAVEFQFEQGVSTLYGDGCPGASGFVPQAFTSGGHPLPGNSSWTLNLANANSQMTTALLIGTDRTQIRGVPLPVELRFAGAPGCDLLTNVAVIFPGATVGGGHGSGVASFNIPVPPVTIFQGAEMFSQWLVLDDDVTSTFVLSNGVWHIFG
ncbi:MAG: hypothetical protein AAF628_04685 [Planctomycetota bacterium]